MLTFKLIITSASLMFLVIGLITSYVLANRGLLFEKNYHMVFIFISIILSTLSIII